MDISDASTHWLYSNDGKGRHDYCVSASGTSWGRQAHSCDAGGDAALQGRLPLFALSQGINKLRLSLFEDCPVGRGIKRRPCVLCRHSEFAHTVQKHHEKGGVS